MAWDFPVSEKKINELKQRFEALDLHEKDLEESFILGSGKGGQKVNKTYNGVDLLHTPTGCRVQCHQARERSMNRFFARRLLVDAIEKEQNGGLSSKEEIRIEKIRKQKKRRKRRNHQNGEQNP